MALPSTPAPAARGSSLPCANKPLPATARMTNAALIMGRLGRGQGSTRRDIVACAERSVPSLRQFGPCWGLVAVLGAVVVDDVPEAVRIGAAVAGEQHGGSVGHGATRAKGRREGGHRLPAVVEDGAAAAAARRRRGSREDA